MQNIPEIPRSMTFRALKFTHSIPRRPKINDVGPLTPGRIIDFNERTMRYFDPSLQRGVIEGIKVTPLSGDDWTPGPVA